MYRQSNYPFLLKGFFLSGACVKAEAATLLTFLGVLGLLRSFEAVEATLLDVFSLFAITLKHNKIK